MPVLSIITPLFNKELYIGETIRSVLAQTLADWEMIVVDNGSTDKGPEVARQFSDARIRLVSSPKRGPGAARNFGLGLATGEWILFLDADDLLEPDYLAARLASAARTPDAQIVAGFWQEFSDASSNSPSRGRPAGWGGPAAAASDAAIGSAPWIVHAALVRRSWLTPERSWPEELDRLPSEDAAFWFRVVLGARIAWCDHAGALYRMATATSRDAFRDAETRVNAVTAVIQHNIEFLRAREQKPSQKQCRTLMHVFEDTYRRASTVHAKEPALMALKHAQEWLQSCSPTSLSIILRKAIGLRLFNLTRFGVWPSGS
jgi:glycosyltransferase involved in cell wall biosynthesis